MKGWIAGIALLALGCGQPAPSPPPPPVSAPPAPTLAERIGDHAFVGLIDPGSGLGLKAGGTMPLHAETCGACHAEIYAEWRQSTHATAVKDLQFVAEISKPNNPRWLCLNCHIPLQPQRAYRVQPDTRLRADGGLEIERVPNPGHDPKLAAESITCATCHVRRGPDGRGVVIGPTGGAASPHLVRRDPEALRTVCTRCHEPGDVTISPTLTCWFHTDAELKAGPQAAQGCVDCHMPQTRRAVAVGGTPRVTRRHLWAGGGVPKSFAAYDHLIERDYRPAVDVAVGAVRVAGGRTEVSLTLHNARGGHWVPTADPERYLLVEARLEDAAGAVVARRTARVGQHWDYGDATTGRQARKLTDNRLKPGERRAMQLRLPTTGAQVVVEVKHVRLSPANAAYTSRAQVPPEVRALAPEAAARLPELTRHYPLFTYVFSERRVLGTSAVTRASLAELLAWSKAAAGWSMARLKAELAD